VDSKQWDEQQSGPGQPSVRRKQHFCSRGCQGLGPEGTVPDPRFPPVPIHRPAQQSLPVQEAWERGLPPEHRCLGLSGNCGEISPV
jgi:hypothetical protein